jgi:predicted small metal-binding protein
MYQYDCSHLIPGCTTKETGDTREEVHKKAVRHHRKHHLLDEVDKGFDQRINLAIFVLEH